MTDTMATAAEVSTGLYIGGEQRQTIDALDVADPGKPGVIVGPRHPRPRRTSTMRSPRRRRHFRRGRRCPRTSAPSRCAPRSRASTRSRDDDAAILSQENGKIRFEAWIDALVFEIRWQLALMLADQVDIGKVLARVPGIPVETTVSTSLSGSSR